MRPPTITPRGRGSLGLMLLGLTVLGACSDDGGSRSVDRYCEDLAENAQLLELRSRHAGRCRRPARPVRALRRLGATGGRGGVASVGRPGGRGGHGRPHEHGIASCRRRASRVDRGGGHRDRRPCRDDLRSDVVDGHPAAGDDHHGAAPGDDPSARNDAGPDTRDRATRDRDTRDRAPETAPATVPPEIATTVAPPAST